MQFESQNESTSYMFALSRIYVRKAANRLPDYLIRIVGTFARKIGNKTL